MGSAVYHLKALWPGPMTETQATAVNEFFRQVKPAYDYWQDHRDGGSVGAKALMLHFKKEFPRVYDYLDLAGLTKIKDSNELSGNLDINPEGDEPASAGEVGIRHAAEVWHMGSWQHLETYLQSLGAIHVSWLSDEDANVGQLLDAQDDTAVVQAIMNKPLDELTAFLGIHPILDARIATRLAKPAPARKSSRKR